MQLRPHLLASVALFLVLAFSASSDDKMARIGLLLPAVLLYFASLVSYGFEYDAFAKSAAGLRKKTLAERVILQPIAPQGESELREMGAGIGEQAPVPAQAVEILMRRKETD
ncbi:MAG: hypothetical protein WC792_02190 [Candidatus Micrarchaeia archaeon]|jgi:hypothetical protein